MPPSSSIHKHMAKSNETCDKAPELIKRAPPDLSSHLSIRSQIHFYIHLDHYSKATSINRSQFFGPLVVALYRFHFNTDTLMLMHSLPSAASIYS